MCGRHGARPPLPAPTEDGTAPPHFGKDKLLENFNTVMDAIVRAKPAAAKGQYIRNVTLASSMGPGVKVSYNV